MELTKAQQHYLQNSCTIFYPYQTTNMETLGKNLFMSATTVWLSPLIFSEAYGKSLNFCEDLVYWCETNQTKNVWNTGNILFMPLRCGFCSLICMKLTATQWHYMEVSHNEFHSYWSSDKGSIGIGFCMEVKCNYHWPSLHKNLTDGLEAEIRWKTYRWT